MVCNVCTFFILEPTKPSLDLFGFNAIISVSLEELTHLYMYRLVKVWLGCYSLMQ